METQGNKIILTGNAGATPVLRSLPDGRQVVSLSVATTSRWLDRRDGKPRKHTEWHTVVFWDEMAEDVAKRVVKGLEVYIEGEIRTREWKKDGVKRSVAEIQATDIIVLGAAKFAGTPARPAPAQELAE